MRCPESSHGSVTILQSLEEKELKYCEIPGKSFCVKLTIFNLSRAHKLLRCSGKYSMESYLLTIARGIEILWDSCGKELWDILQSHDLSKDYEIVKCLDKAFMGILQYYNLTKNCKIVRCPVEASMGILQYYNLSQNRKTTGISQSYNLSKGCKIFRCPRKFPQESHNLTICWRIVRLRIAPQSFHGNLTILPSLHGL